MINAIFKGMSAAIHKKFGDGCEIYFSQDVSQGLTPPAFLLSMAGAGVTRLVGGRYRHTLTALVQYFPQDEGGNAEMIDAAEGLQSALEVIDLLDGSQIRGLHMEHQIQEGILNFFVDYTFFMRTVDAEEPMEILDVQEKING
jgi:hypothetical protein